MDRACRKFCNESKGTPWKDQIIQDKDMMKAKRVGG